MGIFLWRVNVILSSAPGEPSRSITDFEHATPLLPQGTLWTKKKKNKYERHKKKK
jgi:hypothetical protein